MEGTGEGYRKAELNWLKGELLLSRREGDKEGRKAGALAQKRFRQAQDMARHQQVKSLELEQR